ncbi:hypothetical protein AJ80_03496 [Polytolypa hystricis UAMH7299]|uniref:Uncharacterized protein n=1 Tax=Polytolypa hystricis (strain UAMH7299) TaxID=1447883 RepID=A0A2B7YGS2_POLH7|nr:hypothetical protein AJ80_03496 [Polytolypa hystricis UAMH7299]
MALFDARKMSPTILGLPLPLSPVSPFHSLQRHSLLSEQMNTPWESRFHLDTLDTRVANADAAITDASTSDLTASQTFSTAERAAESPITADLTSTGMSSCSCSPPEFLKSVLKNTNVSIPAFRGIGSDSIVSDGHDADDELDEIEAGDSEFETDSELDITGQFYYSDEEEDPDGEYTEDEDEDAETDEAGSDMDDMDDMDDNGAFIAFSNSVHFNSKVEYFFPPAHESEHESENEREQELGANGTSDDLEMTFHEKMQLADAEKQTFCNGFAAILEEYDPAQHTPDLIALDKQLFLALVNGLRTMHCQYYRPIMRSRTLHAKPIAGNMDIISNYEKVKDVNTYLDGTIEFLLGFFPGLFTTEQYAELLGVAESVTSFDLHDCVIYGAGSKEFQQILIKMLAKEFTAGTAAIDDEVLNWLAGEIIEPLGRCASIDST